MLDFIQNRHNVKYPLGVNHVHIQHFEFEAVVHPEEYRCCIPMKNIDDRRKPDAIGFTTISI